MEGAVNVRELRKLSVWRCGEGLEGGEGRVEEGVTWSCMRLLRVWSSVRCCMEQQEQQQQ